MPQVSTKSQHVSCIAVTDTYNHVVIDVVAGLDMLCELLCSALQLLSITVLSWLWLQD